MTVRNGTLIIVEVETSDGGKYTCSSQNSAGITEASSNVSVAGKQVILVQQLMQALF